MAKLSSTQIYGDLQVDGEIKNKASTTSEGVVQLNDNVNSTSITQGATANAVKKVNDAVASHTTNTTSHITASERTTWNGKLDKSGGTVTGGLTVNGAINVTLNAPEAIKATKGNHVAMMGCSTTAGDFLFGGGPVSTGAWSDYVRIGANKLIYKTNGTEYKIYHAGNKPTPSEIGAVNINTAMGENLKDYPSSNLDSIDGTVFRYGNSTATSKPSGTDHAILQMTYDNNLWKTQLAHDWRTNKLYTRTKNNGTWGAWSSIYSTINKPTPAEIGAIKVYNSLSEIGSGFSVTTPLKDVILAMEDNSMAVYEVGSTQGIYPQGYSTVVIYKVNSGRNVVFCRSNGTSSFLYTTNYHSNSNIDCTWSKVADGGNADTVDGKHASDFATSGHTHSYLPLSGGTLTGDIIFNNSKGVYAKTTTGSTYTIAKMLDSNEVYLGTTGAPLTIASKVNPNVSVGGTYYTLYHAGNKPTPEDIGASPILNGVQRWICTVTCAKWSRIMFLYGNSVVGHSGILNIQGTRANVVYNATFMINSSHNSKGFITQLNNTDYSNFKIRTVVATNGETYIEVYENSNSATTSTTQNLTISYISLSGVGAGDITKYTSFTDGTTLPSGYTVTQTLTTVSGGIIANKRGTGENSVIFGDLDNNVASGQWSFAQGRVCTATGEYSSAIGNYTQATAMTSHAEGQSTKATGSASHSEGESTTAGGRASHAEGNSTQAVGYYSHSEGAYTYAYNSACHAEGYQCVAGDSDFGSTAIYPSHAEGYGTKATGQMSHSEGHSTIASGKYSHAQGYGTTASGESSHAEGDGTTASGKYSHAQGVDTVASDVCCFALGDRTNATNTASIATGLLTTASGMYSFTEGIGTTAETYTTHVIGRYNKVNSGSATSHKATQNAFVIGNGSSSSSKANCFRVVYNGSVYGLSAFNSTGADYAEYFEWADGNVDNEDRIGHFVALEGEKIRFANSEDDYIIGIISGNQSIIGNACEDGWNDMYMRDEFGRLQYEDIEVEQEKEIINEETNESEIITEKVTEKHIKLNPNYDSSVEYKPRSERKEWGVVGMLGQIIVKDDGTCKVNGYCKPSKNGIATASDNKSHYRVMSRISDNLVKVIMK